jgi:hypothetical protein
MAVSRRHLLRLAAALLALAWSIAPLAAQPAQVDTIKDVFARLRTCWRPPPPGRATQNMDITVIVSFNRSGNIMGRPKITYESAQATDNDRLQYRIAIMETLQRCTPMPFTESMAGAVAGHPFAVRFRTHTPSLQPTEKRAWLLPKIL